MICQAYVLCGGRRKGGKQVGGSRAEEEAEALTFPVKIAPGYRSRKSGGNVRQGRASFFMFGVGRRTNSLRGVKATYNTFHGWRLLYCSLF